MRRAFVMPTVVLLALVASLAVTVLLNRNSVRRSDAEYALDSYIEEHRQRGIRELIALWLQFSGQQDLEGLLGEDGLAFTLEYSADRELRVRLVPMQSAPLTDPEGLGPMQPTEEIIETSRQREIVERTALALGERAGAVGRTSGPLGVSLRDASPETIRAITMAVVGDEQIADDYTNRLVRYRNEQNEIDRGQLVTLAGEAGIETALQTQLTAIWTMLPSLWGVRAELTGPGEARRDRTLARYEAMVFIPREEATSELLTGSEHPSAWFLEWNRLDEGVGYTSLPGQESDTGGGR